MWLSQSALERIRELETQLIAEREAHARERGVIAERYTLRIAELERRVDWQADMLLRRAQTYPVPPVKEQSTDDVKPVHRPLSPTVLAKYESIRLEAGIHGKQMNDPDVAQWVKDETGFTPSEIEQRLQAQLSSELEQ